MKTEMRRSLLSLLGLCVLAAHAAPPHPDLLQNQTFVNSHRRRLKEVQTRLLNPMVCQHMSDDECTAVDDGFVEQTQRLRRIMESTGTLKTLVVLVQFQDHASRRLPSKSQIHNMFHATVLTDDAPTGSVGEFIRTNSYGKFRWETTILDWRLTDRTETEYSFGSSGLKAELAYALHPILNAYEAQGFDFSQFDQDKDGRIDSLVFMHSGYAAEVGGVDCTREISTNEEDHKTRIWSHAIGPTHASWQSSRHENLRTGKYMVASSLRGTCGSELVRIGVFTHELLHTIGLPDLYDGTFDGSGLGIYDIMSNPYGYDGSQNFPAHLSPWCRAEVGWLEPTNITHDGVYHLQPSALEPEAFRIDHGFPDGEYLLIENRQNLFWDAHLYGRGLLIYHIDDKVGGNWNMIRGFPGQAGWPGNGKHYRVALVQPDKSFDLETGGNIGDKFDYFVPGAGHKLLPGPIEFGTVTPDLYPNSNSYQEGILQKTGIRISDIIPTNTGLSFRVTGVAPAPANLVATPGPTLRPTNRPTPNPTERPTQRPTNRPTPNPTERPTLRPTNRPTPNPTERPTLRPTNRPTDNPTPRPTFRPTANPTPRPTERPTLRPTKLPTESPTLAPQTTSPTDAPTPSPSRLARTLEPSPSPSVAPTPNPSFAPTTAAPIAPPPTFAPTKRPTTVAPTPRPSGIPTTPPTTPPTLKPSYNLSASAAPSDVPSTVPSQRTDSLEVGSTNKLSDNLYDPSIHKQSGRTFYFFGG